MDRWLCPPMLSRLLSEKSNQQPNLKEVFV